MEECVEGVFLANSFLGLHGSEFLPKGRQPLPLLNFIYFNSGHPLQMGPIALCSRLGALAEPSNLESLVGLYEFLPHPSSQSFTNLLSNTERAHLFLLCWTEFFQLHLWLEI